MVEKRHKGVPIPLLALKLDIILLVNIIYRHGCNIDKVCLIPSEWDAIRDSTRRPWNQLLHSLLGGVKHRYNLEKIEK